MSAPRAFCAECSHEWELCALVECCPNCASRQVRGPISAAAETDAQRADYDRWLRTSGLNPHLKRRISAPRAESLEAARKLEWSATTWEREAAHVYGSAREERLLAARGARASAAAIRAGLAEATR